MGADLSAAVPASRTIFEQADEILDRSLSRVMWEGPEEELTQTRNAQPAILVHSCAVLAAVDGRLSDVVLGAGHSLGEFSAHVAAGTLSFDDALRAVQIRGELMFSAGQARAGAMAAVLGLDDEALTRICAEYSMDQSVVGPANFNSPGQVVISGDVSAVERVTPALQEAGARRVVRLNVSGAFHSPLMSTAEAGLRAGLESATFCSSRFPVISNVTGEATSGGDEARDLLVAQLTSPVQWSKSVGRMVDSGVERFLEVGPGSVLRGLNRRNAKGIKTTALGTLQDIDGWEQI